MRNKPKTKRGGQIRPPKQAEVKYRRLLLRMVRDINELIKTQVLPVIRENKNSTITDSVEVRDGFIADIASAFAVIQTMFKFKEPELKMRGAEYVGLVAGAVDKRADAVIERAGFNVGTLKQIVDQEKIGNALDAMTAENVDLITNMGTDYLRKIQTAVTENYLTGKYTGNGGLEKQLNKISGVAKNRAKLIARDQTSKITGSINQIRSQAAGAIGYAWHNAQDQRVRGNPNGKYPDVPKTRNHWDREGKYYLWEHSSNPPIAPDGKPFRQPPVDGHPGIPINCRCHSSPVWVEKDGSFTGG